MKLNTLHDAFVHELKDLYNAETQLTKALPKMAKTASNKKLSTAFSDHLEETKNHAERLKTILSELDASTRGDKCKAMEGLIEEGEENMKKDAEPEVMDAMLIGIAQKVEHYEIAGYGTVRTFAQRLGYRDAATLLQKTLDEESAADQKLTKIAESAVNEEAADTGKEDKS